MRKIFKAGKITRLIVLSFFALFAAALPLVPANAAQVAVTVEKLTTVDGGFIVEPELVEFTPGAMASEVLMDLLRAKKIYFDYYVSELGFFLSKVENLGVVEASGWMITVKNFFIQKSAGFTELSDGDVMRWQYTVDGGSDLGMNINALGTNAKANKDKLIWKVAEINAAGNKSSYSAYNAAVSVLKKLDATQAETNSALAALNADTSGGGDNNDGGSNNSGSDNNNSSGSSNNSGSDNNNNGGSNTGTDNNNSGGSNTGTDNSNSSGSNTGTDNSNSSGGSNNSGTDNSNNSGTDNGASAKVGAEIIDEPAVTPPVGTEAGTNPRKVAGSDMEDLGFGDVIATNANGGVTVSESAFKAALADSGISVDAEKPVTPLPVFRAGVSAGGTALVTLKVSLDAYAGETLADVSVFKMTYEGLAARLNRVRSGEALKHGRFIWTDAAGVVISSSAAVTTGKDYFISVAIKDDSDFDLDGWTEGSIVDPLALAVEDISSSSESVNQGSGNSAWNTPSGGFGGGCDAGAFGVFAPFALAALAFAETRRKR